MSACQIVLILFSSLIGLFLLAWLVGRLLRGASDRYPDQPHAVVEEYPGELDHLRELLDALTAISGRNDEVNQLLAQHFFATNKAVTKHDRGNQ